MLLMTSCVCSLDISVPSSDSAHGTFKGAHTFVVGLYIAEMVSAGIMRFADAHRVVGEVDIAVVALCPVSSASEGEFSPYIVVLTEELRHFYASLGV